MALKHSTTLLVVLAIASSPVVFAQDTTDVDSLLFHGYACTQDCSGHEAGYEWAQLHNITDPDECGGNSQSFIEGCQAYANETMSENPDCPSDQDSDSDSGDDTDGCR